MSKAFAIVLGLALLTITSCELAKPVKLASSFPPQTQYDVFPDTPSPGETPRFQAARTPDGTLLGIEEQLRAPVIPGCPDLLGRMDLVRVVGDELRVVDFKTSRSKCGPASASAS